MSKLATFLVVHIPPNTLVAVERFVSFLILPSSRTISNVTP